MRMKGKKIIFGYKDTFSMHETLRPVILEALIKFRDTIKERSESEKGYGVPFFDDKYLESDGEGGFKITAQERSKAWFSALDEMIEGFSIDPYESESIKNYSNIDNWLESEKERYEKIKKTHEMFGKYLYHLFW